MTRAVILVCLGAGVLVAAAFLWSPLALMALVGVFLVGAGLLIDFEE